MTLVLLASVWSYVLGIATFVVAVFLILLILVQRGRGGGLTGALGGMGGQSAFGTKAGDMFTRVTMVTAAIWILLCMATIKLVSSQNPWGASGKVGTTAPATPGKDAGKTGASRAAPGDKPEAQPAAKSDATESKSAAPAGTASGGAAPATEPKTTTPPAEK
jgi:preprotein translocase subunit SecG